ncbi:transglutaminase family protein [Methylobrevis pamukkalensis]|uniref:Protein-glutamine gamma-glutamyltransferase n=1 Tax=Methylobrevis pamukkalensis TaxID=1439726 RepID=A0A1E3H455_9HYPH|nr:Protein-glutamine gamma-glutamyltransferase [Methylobrevis pamukkalensis]
MIYDIRQVTTYSYRGAVPFSRHVMRMAPVTRPGQRVILSSLDIDPQPAEYQEESDFFGNRTTLVAIDQPHDRLVVELRARVEVTAPEPFLAGLTPPWEDIRDTTASSDDLSAESPVHFIFASRSVALEPNIRDYAAAAFPEGEPVLTGALELTRMIHTDFKYKPGATDAKTLPATAFRQKSGVCQDFAHVMISGMRGLGLPARYVSGYLRTIPPPGQVRLEGADATHAWVEVWCGPEMGWIGLDPTNDIPAGEDHIVLAVGRDYSDVSPMDGVVVTVGDHGLDVKVDVIPLGQDVAERAAALAKSAATPASTPAAAAAAAAEAGDAPDDDAVDASAAAPAKPPAAASLPVQPPGAVSARA